MNGRPETNEVSAGRRFPACRQAARGTSFYRNRIEAGIKRIQNEITRRKSNPSLENAHAIAYLKRLMPRTERNELVVVCLSGRGGKDIDIVKKVFHFS